VASRARPARPAPFSTSTRGGRPRLRKSCAAIESGEAPPERGAGRRTPSTNETANAITAIPVMTSRTRSVCACTLLDGQGVPEADGAGVDRTAGIHQVADPCTQDGEDHLVDRMGHARPQHGPHRGIEGAARLEEVCGVEG